jgi:hypothetical protein
MRNSLPNRVRDVVQHFKHLAQAVDREDRLDIQSISCPDPAFIPVPTEGNDTSRSVLEIKSNGRMVSQLKIFPNESGDLVLIGYNFPADDPTDPRRFIGGSRVLFPPDTEVPSNILCELYDSLGAHLKPYINGEKRGHRPYPCAMTEEPLDFLNVPLDAAGKRGL